jgi:hypothetical protein
MPVTVSLMGWVTTRAELALGQPPGDGAHDQSDLGGERDVGRDAHEDPYPQSDHRADRDCNSRAQAGGPVASRATYPPSRRLFSVRRSLFKLDRTILPRTGRKARMAPFGSSSTSLVNNAPAPLVAGWT